MSEHVHEWIPMGDDMVRCFHCKEFRGYWRLRDSRRAGEGPYVLGDELKTDVWRRTLFKIANLAYADGLRMAAEMFRASKWTSFKESVPIDGFGFYQSLLSKAKEIEEGKGEK